MPKDVPTVPRLVVESGLHKSASSDIVLGETSVGAGLENGISVSDLAGQTAFRISRDGQALFVQALDTELLADGKRLKPGQRLRCKRSLALSGGGVRFRLELPQAADQPTGRRHSASISYVGAFTGGALFAGVLTAAMSLNAATATFVPRFGSISNESTASIPSAAPAAAAAGTTAIAPPAILDGLRQQAAAAGLDMLQFQARPDGSIESSGTIAPAQAPAWHDIARWFDTAAQGRTVLVDSVQTTTAAPALQIQAVWPGRNPYVVDGSGQKLFVGSALPNGWSIQRVDKQRVLIKRGEQIVAVRF